MRKCRLTKKRRELVVSHLQLARRLARQFYRERGFRWAEWEDVESAAMLGLCEAARAFEPALTRSFSTYAYVRIRGEMFDLLRRAGVPRARRKEGVPEEGGGEAGPQDLEAAEPLPPASTADSEGARPSAPPSSDLAVRTRRGRQPRSSTPVPSISSIGLSAHRSQVADPAPRGGEHPIAFELNESSAEAVEPESSGWIRTARYPGRSFETKNGWITCRVQMSEADAFDFLGINCDLVDLSDDPPVSYARQESIETTVMKRLFFRRAMEVCRTLPERQQKVLRLHYEEDLSYEQMRHQFGNASRSWLCRLHSRSLATLRAALEADDPSQQQEQHPFTGATPNELPRAA